MRRVFVLFCALALLAGAASAQVTTGRLGGVITDSDGVALPGVTVTTSSPALIGGVQTAITDAEGEFQFNLLPPGEYTVRTDLPGFAPAELQARVNLGRLTELRIQMVLQEFADEIQVVAEAPIVDPSQVSTGEVFDQEYLQNAAIGSAGRDYLSIIGQAAGAVGSGNVNVYGSTSSENAYLIDGLQTTDPVTATFGTNFNYDAIQEVNFMTGGFEAEYGQATGGIVNLVTKSGGNDFSGTVDVRYRDNDFYESGDHFDPDTNKTSFRDISGTLGGPIIRDKVWFFISGENVLSETTPPYSQFSFLPASYGFQPGTREYEGWNYIAKTTWQASDAVRAVFKFSGDPADISYASAGASRPPEADRFQSQGGDIWQAEANAVLSDTLLFGAQVGINRQELDSYPMSGDLDTPGHYNLDTGLYSVNYSNAQYSERNRDQARANLTWFVDDLAGSHELKGGVEWNDMEFLSRNFSTGGMFFYDWQADYDFDGVDDTVDVHGDGITDYIVDLNYPAENYRTPLTSTGEMLTAFIQDAWRPMSNLTIKPGLRWDNVAFTNSVGTEVADMGRVQPRLGVAWDINNNGKQLLRLNYGRFMHPAALTVPDFVSGVPQGTQRYVGLEYWCTFYGLCTPDDLANYWPEDETFVWTDPEGREHFYYLNQTFGLETAESIDTLGVGSLEAPYADEIIVAYEHQVADNTSVELSYVNKETRSLMEDTCNNNAWAWGDGTEPTIGNPDSWTNIDECSGYVLANLPDLERNYEGYIVKLESRARDWFHVLASYTYSESEGNTDVTAGYGYASGDYDLFPLHFYNLYGFLGDHRDHRVKLNGFFLLPYDFTIGFDAFWSSAGTRTFFMDCANVGAGEFYDEQTGQVYTITPEQAAMCLGGDAYGDLLITPRGSIEGDDNYGLDLQVSKGFNVGDLRFEVIGTVLNVTSNEKAVAWTNEVLQLDPLDDGVTPDADSPASIGEAVQWNTPRRYELGVRFEF